MVNLLELVLIGGFAGFTVGAEVPVASELIFECSELRPAVFAGSVLSTLPDWIGYLAVVDLGPMQLQATA